MKRVLIALIFVTLYFVGRAVSRAAVVLVAFDTGNYEIEDVDGTVLSGGLPNVDHDGTVVQLGYYNILTGGFMIWTPLTGEGSANSAFSTSTIGDDSNVQIGDGMFASGWYFTIGSPTAGQNLPSLGTPLLVRFYSANNLLSSFYFKEVSNPLWPWPTPGERGVNEPVVVMSLDDPGTKMKGRFGGSLDLPANFRIRTDIPFQPNIPEPTALALLAAGAVALTSRRRRLRVC